MIKQLILASSICAAATGAYAGKSDWIWNSGPSIFAGLVMEFGGGGSNAGLSIKGLSTNEPGKFGFAGGMTYYFDGTFGCDIGGAYNFGSEAPTETNGGGFGGTATFGYDICKGAPQVGIGGSQRPETECTNC